MLYLVCASGHKSDLYKILNPVTVQHKSEGLMWANAVYTHQHMVVVYNHNYDIISHTFVVPSLLTLMLKSWQGLHKITKNKFNSLCGGAYRHYNIAQTSQVIVL